MSKWNIINSLVIIFVLVNVVKVLAIPVDIGESTATTTTTNDSTNDSNISQQNILSQIHVTTATTPTLESNNITDVNSEKTEKTVVDAESENAGITEQETSASNADTALYGLISPEAIQHYVNQFGPGATYGPYGSAAYPAPIGYAPVVPTNAGGGGMYPSPFMVQTGYEGFLIPTTAASASNPTTTTSSNNSDNSTSLISLLNPMTLLANIFPALMMSTLFKIVAAIISAVGMIFLGSTLTSAICTFTPLCDISFRAFRYFRRRDAIERIGNLVTDEVTQDRVRRAAEFVHSAIHKYSELQKSWSESE